MQKEENYAQILSLAAEVLRLAQQTLLLRFRFSDVALGALTARPADCGGLASDGKYLFYDPAVLLRSYQIQQTLPARNLLHILLHFVLRHPLWTDAEPELWNLACDIAVECCISGLECDAVSSAAETEQQMLLSGLSLTACTAESIYRSLLQKHPDGELLERLKRAFYADDHSPWHRNLQENGQLAPGQPGAEAERDAEEKRWRNIAVKMLTAMETGTLQRGERAGTLLQNLRECTRKRQSYADFLRRFAARCEVMKTDTDSFDYIYYTYGLKLYDRMPLIEPLEYREDKRLTDFVIAIDTSGSVLGETVQKFAERTFNILHESETFARRFNLHIIQCDAQVQEDTLITSREDFDRYLSRMKLLGFGGTDYRPVFSYVEQLRAEGALSNLKGMLYFTDGIGIFPEKKPDFETVFVFLEETYTDPDVPAWAMKLVLKPDEI